MIAAARRHVAGRFSGARFAASAACFLPLVLIYGILLLLLPPDAAQMTAADPLVKLLLPFPGAWSIALLSGLVALAWIIRYRPASDELQTAARFAVAGVIAGLACTLLIRLLYGDSLPRFVPAEESAAPGIALGFGAGTLEEALFRLGVLPLAFFALRKSSGDLAAAAMACVLAGLAFALSHEPGAAGTFDMAHFMTRLLIPGMAMSLVAILVHPAFMIAAHCAAHIGIALLFVLPA